MNQHEAWADRQMTRLGLNGPGAVERPDPRITDVREALGIAIGTALARLDPEAEVFEWHPCTDQPACCGRNGGPCPCSGRPFAAPPVLDAAVEEVARTIAEELDQLASDLYAESAEQQSTTWDSLRHASDVAARRAAEWRDGTR